MEHNSSSLSPTILRRIYKEYPFVKYNYRDYVFTLKLTDEYETIGEEKLYYVKFTLNKTPDNVNIEHFSFDVPFTVVWYFAGEPHTYKDRRTHKAVKYNSLWDMIIRGKPSREVVETNKEFLRRMLQECKDAIDNHYIKAAKHQQEFSNLFDSPE